MKELFVCGCGECTRVRAVLSTDGFVIKEIKEPEALEEYLMAGALNHPVARIDGELVTVKGADAERLKELAQI